MSNDDLVRLVNASGFLLQLRIEEEVRSHQREHGWQIVGREHPWTDPAAGQEGFIDLILGQGIARMVIECKRALDAEWVFLIPNESSQKTCALRILHTIAQPNQPPGVSFDDWEPRPESYEAAFCIIRGQGQKDKPLLERICGTILKSVDSLAAEEIPMRTKLLEWMSKNRENIHGVETIARLNLDAREDRLYLPTIVTTANLYVCRFDPSKVSIENGQLPGADFESVPFIRFRKTLSTELPPGATSSAQYIEEADKEKEQTVFVVQAGHLLQFLKECPS